MVGAESLRVLDFLMRNYLVRAFSQRRAGMSDGFAHVFLSGAFRDSVSQLQVLREEDFEEFFNPDGEDELKGKGWQDVKSEEDNYKVAKIPVEELKSKSWLIVHDLDTKTLDGVELETRHHLTDEDPVEFIKKFFVHSRGSCKNRDEHCKDWVHNDDSVPHVNLATRYCPRVWGPGNFEGLRVIDTREAYPHWESQLPVDDYYSSYIVFIYATSRF